MRARDTKKIKKATLLCHLSGVKEISAGQLVERESKHGGQSQISQYLGQLRRLKLVKTRRKGQVIYYRLTSPVVKDILKVLNKHYRRKD